ncbi:MAG: beta-lactamase family protein [Acidobacteria bacterium]|nr:beta-lactamase family protein [Acidobacteriota bacterium]
MASRYSLLKSITFMVIVKEIDQFLNSSIKAGDFPGAVYLIAQGKEIFASGVCGDAVITPEKIPATLDTIFDLASLTKPLVTGMLLAQLLEENLFSLKQPISDFLLEFNTLEKRNITIAQVASHSAGFINWLPFYALAKDPSQILSLIAQEPLVYNPGTKVIYSDLSYITLGVLLEKISGKPLDRLLRQRVLDPLNLKNTCFNPPKEWKSKIAASETGNQYEKKLAGDRAKNYSNWREDIIWGEVHDANAHFLSAVAGHAGLFSNARELFFMAQQFLPGSLLVKNSFELFEKNLIPECEEGRSLCWLLAGFGVNAGNTLPDHCFGHVGFTGTSLWLDQKKSRVYILLTNRTHPTYRDFNMNDRRRQFHKLAQEIF